MFWLDHEEPTSARLSKPPTDFEQCLLTLCWMENDYDQEILANYFGISNRTTVSRIIATWSPIWGEVGEDSSVLPFIDEEFLVETEPESYIKLDLRKVGAIIDGKDWLSETVWKDRSVNVAQQSSKSDGSAFRIDMVDSHGTDV